MLAAIFSHNTGLLVWKDGTELLHDEAQPAALKVTPPFEPLAQDQIADYWKHVLIDHLDPVFGTISAWGGVSTKVLWGNVIAVWDGVFDRLKSALPPEDHDKAHQWMEKPVVANGRLKLRNLQRLVTSPVPDICPTIPLRKHCCLHYMLHSPIDGKPEVLCEACPRLHRQSLAAQKSYLRSIHLEHS